ncbi:MAG: hypothetical protein JW955_06455 [Sedimentisphaerales bacterium]|nr:hypothetical protein [Sedimentisphaerales bacterium]
MAPTWGTRRACDTREPKHSIRSVSCNAIRSHFAKVILCALVVSFGWTTAYAAGSGPGIGLKIGAQTLPHDPVDCETTTRARLELEISSPVFADDHIDLALTLGGSSLGSFHDHYVEEDEGVLFEEWYGDDFWIFDVRLAARLYPFGYNRRIRPYIGVGIGYFWFLDNWEYKYAETFEDPRHPGDYGTYVERDRGTDTLAHGLFPFALAGLAVSVNRHVDLTIELQYDFEKEDAGFDLGGPIYMFGGRIRF